MININIPAKTEDGYYNAIIEIPIGATVKYEYRPDLNIIEVDRFTYTAFAYPFNYGFIPSTLGGDKDPVDIIVFSSQPIEQHCLVKVRFLGALITQDEEGQDTKIIAIPTAKVDPFYKEIISLDQLPSMTLERIKHFYENYKSIEPGKWVKVSGWEGIETATKIVEDGIKRLIDQKP